MSNTNKPGINSQLSDILGNNPQNSQGFNTVSGERKKASLQQTEASFPPPDEGRPRKVGFDLDVHMARAAEKKRIEQKINNAKKASQNNNDLGFSDNSLYIAPKPSMADDISIDELNRNRDNAQRSYQKQRKESFLSKFQDVAKNITPFKFMVVSAIVATSFVYAHKIGLWVTHDLFPKSEPAYNMDRTEKANIKDIAMVKDLSNDKMNSILFYMDYRAADAVTQAAQNWHIVEYSMAQGKISKEDGVALLKETKKAHEDFLQQIQKDKDTMTLFYKQSRDPASEDKLFRVSNKDAEFLAGVLALGSSGEKNPALKEIKNYKTNFELFKDWHQRYLIDRYYFPESIKNARNAIVDKLGMDLFKESLTHAHMQISVGVKPQFGGVLFDEFSNARVIQKPNVEVLKVSNINVTEAYRNQMFPDQAKTGLIHKGTKVNLEDGVATPPPEPQITSKPKMKP